jgi:hypothetical protein
MSTAHDRSLLGAADVDDGVLAQMVATLLGHPSVELVSSNAGRVAYDVPSITTIGRYWVSGVARLPHGEELPWRMFVKHVQAWHHSPFFEFVPEEMRVMAAASMPWRIEALVYRSDLADHLPDGFSMPRALGVVDLEPDAVAIWLPEVVHEPVVWTPGRYQRAAHLLGRLSASPAVAERAGVGDFAWSVFDYVHGRLAGAVLPTLFDDEAWRPPFVSTWFDDGLRDRMRAAARGIEALAAELVTFPTGTSHGDASPQNLLPGATADDLVLIDFNFWMTQPVGFDLGQLVAGETQLGRGPADLAAVDAACVAAYTRGLACEGTEVDEDVVRRAHAIQLFLFAGVSALPDAGMTAGQVSARAGLARHSLNLLDSTG